MQQIVDGALRTRRVTAQVFAALAASALALAMLGVHAMMAYGVRLRRREIGIRLAIGAARSQVMRDVLGRGARLGAAGAALGLLGAVAVARGLQRLLYGIQPLDAVSFVGAAAAVLVVAIVGSYVPARHAAGVDPLDALREA